MDARRRVRKKMGMKEPVFTDGELLRAREIVSALPRPRTDAQKHVTFQGVSQVFTTKMKVKEPKPRKEGNDHFGAARGANGRSRSLDGKLTRNAPHLDGQNSQKSNNNDTGGGSPELGRHVSPTHRHARGNTKPPEKNEIGLLTYKALIEEENGRGAKKPLRFLIRRKKPAPRPITPRVEEPPCNEDERELAIIHLQKLLRGRSVQYDMVVGKENHLDFIQRRRAVKAL